MKTLKFKTNLKCNGCVATIKPHLDAIEGIDNWNVNLESTDKTLVIQSDTVGIDTIINTATQAGYIVESMD